MITLDQLRASEFFTSFEIENALRRLFAEEEEHIERLAASFHSEGFRNIFLVGCGAPHAALYSGQYLMDRFSEVPTSLYTGYEFITRKPATLGEKSYVIVASYSGQTPEVVESMRMAKRVGAKTIAVTRNAEAPLAKEADELIQYDHKVLYVYPMAVVYLLCMNLIRRERSELARKVIAELHDLPDRIQEIVSASEEKAKQAAYKCLGATASYVVAAGPLYGLAFKLSLSVIAENLWLDTAVVHAGEFYHGPLELVEGTKRNFLFLAGSDGTREVVDRGVRFCRERGVNTVVFDARDYPVTSELLSPFVLFPETEWFIIYQAYKLGHDVDERRYMGKVGKHWGDYGF